MYGFIVVTKNPLPSSNRYFARQPWNSKYYLSIWFLWWMFEKVWHRQCMEILHRPFWLFAFDSCHRKLHVLSSRRTLTRTLQVGRCPRPWSSARNPSRGRSLWSPLVRPWHGTGLQPQSSRCGMHLWWVREQIIYPYQWITIYHQSPSNGRWSKILIKGYKLWHDSYVTTLFSAPNYCYRCGNKAAIIEFDEHMNNV